MTYIADRFFRYCLPIIFVVLANAAYAATPQSGWWWNPSEGGRGYTIEAQNNTIFMAGYMYDNAGRPVWYAAGPAAMNGSTFTAALLTYVGGQTLNGAYRATTGSSSNGNISITFSDSTHGVISWANGTTTAIERFNIVSGGVASLPSASSPQTGWWWNAAEGGRGFSIEVQNGTMFIAGYMYDDSGNPIWYASGPTPMASSSAYSGTWQQYGNGQTLMGAYKSAAVANANVGNISVSFASPTSATLTLPNGNAIALTRFGFGGSSGSSNPLGLNPAPQFTPSGRSVYYDDCFPKYNDVIVGDVAVSNVETYSAVSKTISNYNTTATVKSVSPYSFNGAQGVSVITDIPSQRLPDLTLMYATETTTAFLKGSAMDLMSKTYMNDAFGVRTITTATPIALGDLSSGHTVIPFNIGDNVTNSASFKYENKSTPNYNSQGTYTEKITFIGVEENTLVQAGRFDYTCVFRREFTGPYGTTVNDTYTHKWTPVVKMVHYSSSYPRPLVYQVVSDTAIARRAAAPQ